MQGDEVLEIGKHSRPVAQNLQNRGLAFHNLMIERVFGAQGESGMVQHRI